MNIARAAALCTGCLIASAALVFAQASTIQIKSYRTDPRGGRQLFVAVDISSTLELRSVVAGVSGQERSLTFGACVIPAGRFCLPGWSGLMDLTGVQRGPQVLTVTATDAQGNVAAGSHPFDWDDLPTLTLIEPLHGTVARPDVPIVATCEDDDPAGCTSLVVTVSASTGADAEVVAHGTSVIETTASLVKFANRPVNLGVSARDSAGHLVAALRNIIVTETNGFQREVGSVRFDTATEIGCKRFAILDVDDTRILFQNVSSSGAARSSIRHRATGLETSLPLPAATAVCEGELTAAGAIVIAERQDPDRLRRQVYAVSDTALLLNPTGNFSSGLRVAGRLATWTDVGSADERRGLLYETSTGTVMVVNAPSTDVAANGDFVYASAGDVIRVRGGVQQTIAATPAVDSEPRTDGVNVLYTSTTPIPNFSREVLVHTASGAKQSLGQLTGDDFVLNGGWIAFTRRIDGLQVWLRNPAGEEARITFSSTGAFFIALGSNGDLVYSVDGRMYWRKAESGVAIDVGALPPSLMTGLPIITAGDREWAAGQRWWYSAGRSVFELWDVAGCSFSLSQPSASFGTEGGNGRVTVLTTAGCNWTATTTATWVSLLTGTDGQDDGIVRYQVQPNTTTFARTAALTIAGQPVSITQPGHPDVDADGLPDFWESNAGLNPSSAAGDNGPGGDPDKDGKTNLQEYEAGTHPRGFVTRYFAEGATSAFFDTQFALANPGAAPANVLLRFLTSHGGVSHHWVAVPAMSRRTVNAKAVPNLTTAELSTVVESDEIVVVDRTMTWDQTGYGAHAERGIEAPALTWYLAEGATHSGFNLFYLLQNPSATAVQAEVTYLRPAPSAPIVKTYTVPAASRFNIWINQEGAGLASTDVSAVVRVTNAVPIIVERAMYLDAQGKTFGAGHESAGITAPATEWFLAEGATGNYFDLFILIANPNAAAAAIEARFLLPSGTVISRIYQVAANSRFNILVDTVDPALADTAVSTTIRSTNGVAVIAERAMWWPGPTFSTWQEAHNSPGSTVTGTKWALAEGEVGGPLNKATYILVANTSNLTGSALVTLLFEDGTTASKTVALNANSRFNLDIGSAFPAAAGKRFSTIVESLGATPAQLVVERAMYWNAQGVVWAAGTNAIATRLR